MPSAFVPVHRTADPVEARFVADVLATEGLEVRLIGTDHAAGIGAAQHIMKLRVEVLRTQEAEAKTILDERLSAPMTLDPDSLPDELREDADETSRSDQLLPNGETPPSPRRVMFAIAAPFVFPGASHFYARRPWTGVLLLTGYVVAAWMLSGPAPWATHMAAFAAIGLLLATDIAGGVFGVLASRKGRPPRRPFQQLIVGVTATLMALGAGFAIGKAIPESMYRPRPNEPGQQTNPDAFRSQLPTGYDQVVPALYLFKLVSAARGGD
ncbi:MAG: hypothetical protein ACI9MR_003236 [Myxococcota bacterium]|jgi:hypothetical protein